MDKSKLSPEEAQFWADDMKRKMEYGEARGYQDAFEKVEEDQLQSNDNIYEYSSQTFSDKYENELGQLHDRIEDAAVWEKDKFTVLTLPHSEYDSNGGHCDAFNGLVEIRKGFLRPEDAKLGLCIGVHERVHLHIGGLIRREVFKKHPDVDDFFRNTVLPEWRAGKIRLPKPDVDFIRAKNWSSLYPGGWMGPSYVEAELAVQALDKYFRLLKTDNLRVTQGAKSLGFVFDPDKPGHRPLGEERSLDELFQTDPEKFLKCLVTGYALGEYLTDAYRRSVEVRNNLDMLDLEEGLANHIAFSLTGVEPVEMQSRVRQDPSKLAMANRIKTHTNLTAQQLLNQIRDYQDLAEFYPAIK